jgi:hypothetical protein
VIDLSCSGTAGRGGAAFPGLLPQNASAGAQLHGERRAAGDAAVAFQVFSGLMLQVILGPEDEEFPPPATFRLAAHLDRFWHLDAVWGLLQLVTLELLPAGVAQ